MRARINQKAVTVLAFASAALVFMPACSTIPDDGETVVALIDTGVQVNLAEFSEYEIDQESEDPSGDHGTMVLSVLLGVTGETDAVPSDHVRVLSLDVGGGATAKDLAAAIDAAVDARADLISISMGVRRPSAELEAAMQRADEAEILVVASAGNVRFLDADYPARFGNALSVSAVDAVGNYAPFAAQKSVDTVALGVDIPVLRIDGKRELESGTSLATALVSRQIVSELVSGEIKRAMEHVPRSPAK